MDNLIDIAIRNLREYADRAITAGDQFTPMAQVVLPSGSAIATPAGHIIDDRTDRQLNFLRCVVQELRCTAVMIVSEVWMSMRAEGDPPLEGRPADDPNRLEGLLLIYQVKGQPPVSAVTPIDMTAGRRSLARDPSGQYVIQVMSGDVYNRLSNWWTLDSWLSADDLMMMREQAKQFAEHLRSSAPQDTSPGMAH